MTLLGTSGVHSAVAAGRFSRSAAGSEWDRRGGGHLEPAVEARLVVEELDSASAGPAPLDLDRQAKAAGGPGGGGEVEAQRQWHAGPCRGPWILLADEKGLVRARVQIDRRGVDRHAEDIEVPLEEPDADSAVVGGGVDALSPQVEASGPGERDIEAATHRRREPLVNRLHASRVGIREQRPTRVDLGLEE